MIAALEFLGMRKLINVPQGAENYEVLVPLGFSHAVVMPDGEEPLATQNQCVSLVFTSSANFRRGLPGEPERVFLFDHVGKVE